MKKRINLPEEYESHISAVVNEWFDHAMKTGYCGRAFLYYTPTDLQTGQGGGLDILPEGTKPDHTVWTIARPQAFHGGMTRQQIYSAVRDASRRLPILPVDVSGKTEE
jgi:hypothetical protein